MHDIGLKKIANFFIGENCPNFALAAWSRGSSQPPRRLKLLGREINLRMAGNRVVAFKENNC
jgi:hypothetical protein